MVGKAQRMVSILVEQNFNRAGYYADKFQKGLYLQVASGVNGLTESWVFRFTSPISGKRREMGLGSRLYRTESEARDLALRYRKQLLDGVDPIEYKKSIKEEIKFKHKRQIPFETVAKQCIDTKRHEWTNSKHADQWINTMETYVFPKIGQKPMAKITVQDILSVLEPIWISKTETATRVKQRIETVINWAKALGQFQGENPAHRDGPLKQLLPNASKIKKVKHFSALPFSRVPEFVKELRLRRSISCLALEFLIQTGARTGEVIGAGWNEIDFESRLWIIPAQRMKAKKEHRVPLNIRAVQILQDLRLRTSNNEWLFPSPTVESKPLSSGAFLMLMKSIANGQFSGYTPHGFRSAFRDWASETTQVSNEVVEMALAHTIRNQVEAAYRRGDLLDKRRELMEDWYKYIS